MNEVAILLLVVVMAVIFRLLKILSKNIYNLDRSKSLDRDQRTSKEINQSQFQKKVPIENTYTKINDHEEIAKRKAMERARAKKRREDALAAKKMADERRSHQESEKFIAWNKSKYQKLRAGFEKHKSILINNMANALVINEYGHVEKDSRLDEWNRFLTSVGFSSTAQAIYKETVDHKPFEKIFATKPKNYEVNADPNYRTKSKLTWEIEAAFAKELLSEIKAYNAMSKLAEFDPDSYPENGHAFEIWVAENLKKLDWSAKVTTGSGDQGVDIIANFKGVSVGIQCKRFKKAVGNKAVQEISAGVRHYGLDYSVVISTGGFTKSAKELATSTSVLLVSHRDIPSLSKLIAP